MSVNIDSPPQWVDLPAYGANHANFRTISDLDPVSLVEHIVEVIANHWNESLKN